MLLPIAICLFGQKVTGAVADYFPLTPGAHWTYVREFSGGRGELVQVAGQPIKIGKTLAVPVQPQVAGAVASYYAIGDNTVYLVAYDPQAPFVSPRPVLRVSNKAEKWSWDGVDNTMYIHMDCESTPVGLRKVLGEQREAVQLKIVASVSTTQVKWTVSQTAYYAKGVGLYEMQEVSEGQSKSKATLTLTGYSPHP